MKVLPIVLFVLAVATAIPAWVLEQSRPAVPELTDRYIGVELDFADAAEIRSLGEDVSRIRVVTWEDGDPRSIEVVQEEGAWVIPSRQDYPADGESSVGEAAGRLIGIRKLVPVTEDADAHARLGLIDPLDADADVDDEARGVRATLWDAADKALVDVILGRGVEGAPDKRYVREADQPAVFTAVVEGEFSSRFIDWVEPNPFDLTADRVTRVLVENYSIDETSGTQEMRFQAALSREDSDADWTSEATPDGQVVDDAAVDSIVRRIADLRLADVASRRGMSARQLMSAGIFVTQQGIFGNEGVVRVSTDLGFTYHLFFGEVAGTVTTTDDAEGAVDADRIMAAWVSYDVAADTAIPAEPEAAAETDEGDAEAAGERAEQEAARAEHIAEREATVERLNRKYENFLYIIRDADFQQLRPDQDKLFTDPPDEDESTDADGAGGGGGSPGTLPPGLGMPGTGGP